MRIWRHTHTFFLRLAGREGEESSGRSDTSSLRVKSRRARWVRLDGLTMTASFDSHLFEKSEQQGHAGGFDAEGWLEGFGSVL